jgi:hypothetical protein
MEKSMSLHVDPQNQFVRWPGGMLRSVSARTFFVDVPMEDGDHEAITTLLQMVKQRNLTSQLRKEYGGLATVPSRGFDDWKRKYVNNSLRPLGLTYRGDVPIEVFANLEVSFHTDAFAVSDSVFCVAVVAGPPRDLFFPQTGERYTLSPGKMALFDPALVHALLKVGAEKFDADVPKQVGVDDITVFLSAELYLRGEVRSKFDIQVVESGTSLPPEAHRPDMEDCISTTGLYRSRVRNLEAI